MEFLVGITAGIATEIGESVARPIGKQFGYVVHCNKHIKNLKIALDKLQGRKHIVQEIVDEDRRKRRQITLDVEEWLSKVTILENELEGFFTDGVNKSKCFGGGCPNLVSRRSLSKTAIKRTAYVKSLMEQKFEVISHPASLLRIKPTFIYDIMASIDMQNLKRFPKINNLRVKLKIPMLPAGVELRLTGF